MKFIEEDLQKISIHTLREMGRAFGIKAPTGLTKSQLIQALIDIENGTVKPHVSTSNRGRPALSMDNPSSISQIEALDKLRRIQELITKCEKEIMKIILE